MLIDIEHDSDDPIAGEKLFSGAIGDYRLTASVQSFHREDIAWIHYIDGYGLAAKAALAHVSQDHRCRDDILFPIIFLYRHQCELCLKAIIVFANELYGESFEFPAHHELKELWKAAKHLMIRKWGKSKVLRTVDAQIEEFATFDKGSFAYRYPVERDGATCSHPQMHPNEPERRFDLINIDHFCCVARGLNAFLSRCAYGLWCDLDSVQQANAHMKHWYGSGC